jgi:uncharacterized protein (TIGR03905 family)
MLVKKDLHGVCAKDVSVIVNGNICNGCLFTGGCDGQGKSINSLIAGMPIDWIVERLKHVKCGKRESSCSAELAKLLEEMIKK